MLSALQGNRVVRFDIEAQREGRWTTESISAAEDEAIEIAKRLLDSTPCEAVRVLREHQAWGRVVSTTQVFEERRLAVSPDSRLSNCDDEGAWCDTLEDLYGERSRRTMGQMLRGFLDAKGVTPTELLHSFRVYKRLDSADGLMTAALGRVARARAAATKSDPAAALKSLEKLVREAVMRARDITAVRAMPAVGERGLDGLWVALKGVQKLEERRFQFRHAACRALEACAGLPHRLDMVLGWGRSASEPEASALLDALVADCLGSAALVKDMLGLQPDLRSALVMTVDLARNRAKVPPPRAPGALATIRSLLMEKPFPETRQVLLARARRELSGDRPLAKEGDAGEAKALGQIADTLFCEMQGVYLGGAEMVAALARRWSRLDRPGGFGDLRVPDGSADGVIKAMLGYERAAYGEARKRAAATVILAAVRAVAPAERRDLAPVAALVAASSLPETARKIIATELSSGH